MAGSENGKALKAVSSHGTAHGSCCHAVLPYRYRRCSDRLVSNFCVGSVVFAVDRVWYGEVFELFGDVVSAGVRVSGLSCRGGQDSVI